MYKASFPGGASGEEPTCQCRRKETQFWSLSQEDPLEEGMATRSNILGESLCRSLETNTMLQINYNPI